MLLLVIVVVSYCCYVGLGDGGDVDGDDNLNNHDDDGVMVVVAAQLEKKMTFGFDGDGLHRDNDGYRELILVSVVEEVREACDYDDYGSNMAFVIMTSMVMVALALVLSVMLMGEMMF